MIDVGPQTGEPELERDAWQAVSDELARGLAAEAQGREVRDLRILVSRVGAIVLFAHGVPTGHDPDRTLRRFLRRALDRTPLAHWRILTSTTTRLANDQP